MCSHNHWLFSIFTKSLQLICSHNVWLYSILNFSMFPMFTECSDLAVRAVDAARTSPPVNLWWEPRIMCTTWTVSPVWLVIIAWCRGIDSHSLTDRSYVSRTILRWSGEAYRSRSDPVIRWETSTTLVALNPNNPEIFLYIPWRPKGFFNSKSL